MKRSYTLALLPLLIACESSDPGLSSSPADSPIVVETREALEPDSRRLTFHCKTEKIYPCVNYPILTESHIDEDSFGITFTGVGEIDICLTALGPATVSIDLGSISNGEYEIELNHGELRNAGILKITDTEIDLLFDRPHGIEIMRPSTLRVPEKTYWGRIGYHQASSASLVDEFLQKLSDNGAVFNKQTPGHYFYYEIDNGGEIITNTENSGYYFVRAFIFQYDGDESALKDLIQVDGKNYKNDLSIYAETYKGEQIYNWGN
jgi:hypothetical protein